MTETTAKSSSIAVRTVRDFSEQWARYTDNVGWYGSPEFLTDVIAGLLDEAWLAGKRIAEVGSGTGRIVRMLLERSPAHVYAIEPAKGARETLRRNLVESIGLNVTVMGLPGDAALSELSDLDLVALVGVLHHIPEPEPVLRAAHRALRPGGRIFVWVYAREGNELYVAFVQRIRRLTSRLPHSALRAFVEAAYVAARSYAVLARYLPRLPLGRYLMQVWPRLSPAQRRLVIYDQLNPAFSVYYGEEEISELLDRCGFGQVRATLRHGYGWSVLGVKET